MMKKCELCNFLARTFCESDQANLCWDCDAKVHGANFLVSRHCRTLLCHACRSPTPWKASGIRLGNTVSLCDRCAAQTIRGEDSETDNDHETDTEETDSDDGDDGGDNQVVPLSSTPPPPPASSSSSDRSSAIRCNNGNVGASVSVSRSESNSLKRHRPDDDLQKEGPNGSTSQQKREEVACSGEAPSKSG